MALQVFAETPLHPYQWTPARPVTVVRMAGGGEQRDSQLSRILRTCNVRFRKTDAERQAIDAFFEARGLILESFLWQDIKDSSRGAGSPGLVPLTLVSGTTWKLPDTGVYGGDYPIDDANVLVWDDSPSARTVTAVDTDARTITVSANGSGGLMADYHYYRRVRLGDPFQWSEPIFGIFFADFDLVEVMSNG